MPSRSKFTLLLLLPAVLAWGANTEIAPDQPIVNFRLPTFTPEGNRSWLVRGSEARYANKEQVDIKELNLSIFTGLPDGKVETLLLSPSAQVRPGDLVVRGTDTIRVINDRFEATGSDWNYNHREKKVSIGKNVHVVLHTQLKDILK
jgi:lipopolysaccharide export system protein LptC